MQSVKQGFKFATHVWGYHLVAMLLGIVFISSMSGTLGIIINVLLLAGIVGISLNEGAYLGEKACTVSATAEKQLKEGRSVSAQQKNLGYKRITAAWIMIFGCLPFLLLSGANLIEAQSAPKEAVEQSAAQDQTFEFNYDGEEVKNTVAPINAAARVVFSAYVSVYSLVSADVLNWLFVVFSLPVAAAMAIGYLCGPKMRNRKLYDIVKGKKRKMRGLKVNKGKAVV